MEGTAALVADDHQGSGTSVAVLLHGQPGDARDWDSVVQRLAGSPWRAIVPDRLGYGRTGGPAGGFAANADAVVALLEQLGIGQATLVGHSWAGGVALAAALRHPDRVQRLILVSSVGGPGSVDRLDRILGLPVLGSALTLSGLAALRVSRLRRLLAPVHAPRDPTALETLPEGWMSSWRSFVTEQRALLHELPGIAGQLEEIAPPSVVVIGGVDRVVTPASQESLALRLGSAVVRVPGGGHLIPREAPDVVVEAIVGA
jgi:pimeloyl-ACP methyl ester carboxylesterase